MIRFGNEKKRLGLVLLFSMSILFSCKSNKPEVKIVNKQSDTTSVAKSTNNLFQIKFRYNT
jgi:hypothetical protein